MGECFQECLSVTVLDENAKNEAGADVRKEEEKTAKADEGVPLRMCLTLSHYLL